MLLVQVVESCIVPEWHLLSRLCIAEGVAEDDLFLFQLGGDIDPGSALAVRAPEGILVEGEREGPDATCSESILEVLQLLDESCLYFEVWPPRVEELKGLDHGPPVLAHQVARKDTRGTALASDRVDEDALALLAGFFNEVKYFLRCDVSLVEQDLLLLIKPVEREVNDAHSFPLVLDLLARAVDDPRDLICDDKLHVLKELILFLTDMLRT